MKRSKASKSPCVQSPKSKNTKTAKKDENSIVFTPENRNKECLQSTRTSGGISKCLLTPCRRMGLTRNRLKPLNSPLEVIKSPSILCQSPEESKSPVTSKLSKSKITSPLLAEKMSDIVEINEIKQEASQELNLLTPSPDNLFEDSDTNPVSEPLNLLKSCVVLVNRKVLPKNKRNLIKDIDNPQLSADLVPKSPKLLELKTKTRSSSSGTSSQPKDKSLKIKIVKKNDRIEVVNVDSKSLSQKSSSSYQSDDDDEDFEEKTITDRKAYKRAKLQINKPSKMENSSTLQKEINEIKERIALKQEKLNNIQNTSPKGLSEQELEELIHAWRDGCQRALEELLAISKERGQFKSNMEMEDLLKMLHIPPDLVKYDLEQMAFV